MSTIHGKNAVVYLQGSGANAVPIVEAADWSIDLDYATDEDNAFGDTWVTHVKGLNNFRGSIAGNFDTTQTVIFDSLTQATPRAMYLYPDRSVTARYYYGTVWPKLSPNVPMGLAKMTCAFVGDGQLALN